MPFLNDGYPEEWVQTLGALEKLDFTQIILGHGEPSPKSHLTFFRGYMTDLVAAVKKAAADGATLDEMKKKIADDLAPKYEKGMSKYPLGQYRDRIGLNVEMVYNKVVKKAVSSARWGPRAAPTSPAAYFTQVGQLRDHPQRRAAGGHALDVVEAVAEARRPVLPGRARPSAA